MDDQLYNFQLPGPLRIRWLFIDQKRIFITSTVELINTGENENAQRQGPEKPEEYEHAWSFAIDSVDIWDVVFTSLHDVKSDEHHARNAFNQNCDSKEPIMKNYVLMFVVKIISCHVLVNNCDSERGNYHDCQTW